jgi:4-amino-4-deoxy-L-arabinose transferase-like glycosyltransferase
MRSGAPGRRMTVISEPKPRRRYGDAWTAGAVDFATGTDARAVVVLIVVALFAFLPGFFHIPPVDRDEARFAQATKQMIETGDFVDIRFQDETRYKKPVGIYWLQAAAVELAEAAGLPRARLRIWLYRIPSLIGAIGVVLGTYWAALAFVSRRAAFLAGLIMATSILLGVEARLAKTDAVLSFTVVAAMGAMARAYLAGQGERGVDTNPLTTAAIFWTAIALGILIKGPLIVMIAGLAVVALTVTDRSAAWLLRLKPAIGVLWVLALVLPWFIAIIVRSGDSFFVEAVGHDLLAKVESGQESHGVPPGFYFVLFWVTFFPAAMLAGLAAPAIWRARSDPGAKFLLAWLIPSWIVFELVPTKLPHYVLPLYPAIAILIVGVIDSQSLSRNRWLERGTVWWFILTAAVGLGLIALNVYIGQRLGLPSWAFAAGAAILALFAWTLYRVDGAEAALVRAAAASILLSVAAYALTFAKIGSLFPSVPLADYVHSTDCPHPATVTAGYHEPSLVFLAGTDLKHGDGASAADFLNGGSCRFALIERSQERSFSQRADALGLRYSSGPRVEGYNISGGRPVYIRTYRSERAQ